MKQMHEKLSYLDVSRGKIVSGVRRFAKTTELLSAPTVGAVQMPKTHLNKAILFPLPVFSLGVSA